MKQNYMKIADKIYDCYGCPTRCDSKSKLNYQFENDVIFAEKHENLIIDKINKNLKYTAQKCEKNGYPDIEIKDQSGEIIAYLEVKAQRRTFMTVESCLPKSDLRPSETLALNLSDLIRYFEIEEETQIPTSIIWVLMQRPCIVPDGEKYFFYQKTTELKSIYQKYKNKRRFRRKSGKGDIVDGKHKGVVVNYHFSLRELEKWEFKD